MKQASLAPPAMNQHEIGPGHVLGRYELLMPIAAGGMAMVWAARLPAALPVYPRGHAIVAAGSDDPGCKVRAVRFVTPVSVGDAVDFYYARVSAGKLPVQRRKEGDDAVVAGALGSATYAVYARQRSDGLTEVDVLTAGF